jgi:type I restriction enzyme, S subunit
MNTTAFGWQSRPLSDVATTASGGTPNRNRKDFFDGIIPWVKSGELNDNYIYKAGEHITEAGLKNSSAKIFPAGTVLIAMYGATVGKTAILKTNASTNQAICGISPGPNLDAEYLRYHLIFLRNELLSQRYGGAQPNISQQIIRNQAVTYPPLSEQKSIAHTLLSVQRAIAAQEQIIQTTTELKKALMQKLFTEGLRGEPQKETEIGLVPESWGVVELDEKADSFQYGTSVKCGHDVEGKPVLRIPNVVGGHVDISDLKFGKPKSNELGKLALEPGDLLFVRTNGVKENAGRCSIFYGELADCYFASYLIRVRLDPAILNPSFVNMYSRTDVGTSFLSGKAIRTADGKFNINSGTLKSMLVPVPSIEEQVQIARTLETLDKKSNHVVSRRSSLQELFRTLLHELMTAKIRINEVGLSE